jgi:hypothetical protein
MHMNSSFFFVSFPPGRHTWHGFLQTCIGD